MREFRAGTPNEIDTGAEMGRQAKKTTSAWLKPKLVTKHPGRGIATRVNPEGLKALRILAVEQDRTLQSLAIEVLNDLLVKYGQAGLVKHPAL
jgi:antitoxin-like ribbon-helix-helix protein